MYAYDEWEPSDYERRECRGCEDLNDCLLESAEYMKRILDHLYSEEEFDESLFENDLEELAGFLGVGIPRSELMIERKSPYGN